VYPGGQIGNGLAVLGGDPRSTVGGGSEAAEPGGSAGGTETISAWTAIDATNTKRKARALIRERRVFEGRMAGYIMLLSLATTSGREARR